MKEHTSKRVQNYRENSLLFQENLIVCCVDQEKISRTVQYQNLEYRPICLEPWNFGFLNTKRFSSYRGKNEENRVPECRSIRLVPWNFGTRIPSETVLKVEKTIFRKTRKKRRNFTDRALVYGTLLFAANLKV